MRKLHKFENGVTVCDAHLLEVQRARYAKRNVHEEDEEDVFTAIIRDLPKNACFVNVGTAIGYYPLLARRIRSDLSIHCFEPLPRHLNYLRKNIKLNGLKLSDFGIHELAVSSEPGKIEFMDQSYSSSIVHGNECEKNSTGKGLATRILNRLMGKPITGETLSVNAIGMADIFKVVQTKEIDFLQMDIQGFEEPVLRKFFEENLNKGGEIHSFLVGTHGKEIHRNCCALFENNGYVLHHDEQATKNQPDGIIYCSARDRLRPR
jgi:FkbM family methyltransferase